MFDGIRWELWGHSHSNEKREIASGKKRKWDNNDADNDVCLQLPFILPDMQLTSSRNPMMNTR
jgi:hypothetical protein